MSGTGINRWDLSTRTCVAECAEYTVSPRVCALCTTLFEKQPYWNGTACTACPPNAPNWNGDLHSCSPACSATAPVWGAQLLDKRLYQCASCESLYSGKRPYWNPNSHECLAKCPDEFPATLNKVCQTCRQASSATPYWDPSTQRCVRQCPETERDGVCRTCYELSSTEPYWDADTKTCRSCADVYPDKKPRWDAASKQCV